MVEPTSDPFDIVDVLVFLAELALLAALAVVGTHLAGGGSGVVLAVLLPIAAAALWGRLLAPRARTRLSHPWRLVGKLALFVAASVLLAISVSITGGAILLVGGAGLVTVGELREAGSRK